MSALHHTGEKWYAASDSNRDNPGPKPSGFTNFPSGAHLVRAPRFELGHPKDLFYRQAQLTSI